MEAMTMGERKRIIELYDKGWSTKRIAEALGRCESAVRRIRQQYRERGHLEPLPRGSGRKPLVSPEDREHLRQLVAEQSDATLDELHERANLPVSRSTIFRNLRILKLSYKKKSCTQPNRIGQTLPNAAPRGS